MTKSAIATAMTATTMAISACRKITFIATHFYRTTISALVTTAGNSRRGLATRTARTAQMTEATPIPKDGRFRPNRKRHQSWSTLKNRCSK
jgi:hypothetical protein